MSDHPPKRRAPPFAVWTVCTLLLVVFYLASFGPFVWLWETNRFSEAAGELIYTTVYFPIAWLEANTDFFGDNPIGRAYSWYVELWVPDLEVSWVGTPL